MIFFPDVSLKTQRDTFWITDQTRTWKRQQQDRMLQQSQQMENQLVLDAILTEEDTFIE